MAPLFSFLRTAAAGLVVLASCAIDGVGAQDDGSSSILMSEIGRQSNDSLLWGPYKPNLYFGIRPRIPKSFTGGLMWAKVDNFGDVQNSMFFQLFPLFFLLVLSVLDISHGGPEFGHVAVRGRRGYLADGMI
jgi:hypothetical protein